MLRDNDYSKEFILSIPKTINENRCWIPDKKSSANGYTEVIIHGRRLMLHRVAMCLFYNIDYDDKRVETRHSKDCDRLCFFHEHLQPGSRSDNAKDAVLHGTHFNASKSHCPKCSGEYKTRIIKTGWNRGQICRECPACKTLKNRKRSSKIA
jgi:hypothetical protein